MMLAKKNVYGFVFMLVVGALMACSGADGRDGINGCDGEDGKDGESCTVEPLKKESGYKVICGEDSVGVLLNGLDGSDGKDGDDGSSCKFVNKVGEIKIACGKDTVVVDLPDFEPTIDTIVEVKYMCGTTPYDIAKQFCVGVTLYDLCDGEVYDPTKETCDK